jgi:hypothetical protein
MLEVRINGTEIPHPIPLFIEKKERNDGEDATR